MKLSTFLDDRMKSALFRILIFVMINIICVVIYNIISYNLGIYDWTIENQISTGIAGQIIQIINLIVMIDGIGIFIYVVVFIIYIIKS
jgi:hypothetical protein